MLENKKLLDLANETDDTKFKEEVSKLSEEEKTQLNQHMDEQIVAKRDEKRRQEQLAKDAADAVAKAKAAADVAAATNTGKANESKSFEEKFRQENVAEGFSRVFSEMGITKDEDKQAVRETFNRLDSGAVNVDNIVKDIRKAVLASKPDEFLEAAKRAKDFEQAADELNRGMAGNAGGNSRDEDKGKQYSKEAQDMVRDASRRGQKLTLEEADNYLKNGATRVIR